MRVVTSPPDAEVILRQYLDETFPRNGLTVVGIRYFRHSSDAHHESHYNFIIDFAVDGEVHAGSWGNVFEVDGRVEIGSTRPQVISRLGSN